MVRKLKDKDGTKSARRILYAVSAERMRDSFVRFKIKIGAFVLSGCFIIM